MMQCDSWCYWFEFFFFLLDFGKTLRRELIFWVVPLRGFLESSLNYIYMSALVVYTWFFLCTSVGYVNSCD